MKKFVGSLLAVSALTLTGFAAETAYAADPDVIVVNKREKSKGENVVSDSAITTAVKSKFLADSEITGLNIHVETVNGKVTLTGHVPSKAIEDRAVSIAKTTNGVKAVISKLDIQP